MKEPLISVGILKARQIEFMLNMRYTAKGVTVQGEQCVYFSEGGIHWNGNLYRELTFTPIDERASFSLYDVTIGINFHWERKETQIFSGLLRFVVDEERIIAINVLPAEEYLISVISSEMRATSPIEFLKAHAVISRSWLFAQIERRNTAPNTTDFFSFIKSNTEYIRWYDREDHTIFDVCADDHCQRYQGIAKATNQAVVEAVQATRGMLLMYGRTICDARFSKCCGGATEEYQNCWEEKQFPYLSSVPCSCQGEQPDLTCEETAASWIRHTPNTCCNTQHPRILKKILNHYDQETTDFFRWKQFYTQAELSDIVAKRSKIDFGQIIDLIPVQRGTSGRLVRLKIVGSNCTLTIGKELEIRRTLSLSHLFSSAFVVDKGPIVDGVPQSFTLTGGGWGHGVGLCQIGAAVMGEQGRTYEEILLHYYRGADIRRFY